MKEKGTVGTPIQIVTDLMRSVMTDDRKHPGRIQFLEPFIRQTVFSQVLIVQRENDTDSPVQLIRDDSDGLSSERAKQMIMQLLQESEGRMTAGDQIVIGPENLKATNGTFSWIVIHRIHHQGQFWGFIVFATRQRESLEAEALDLTRFCAELFALELRIENHERRWFGLQENIRTFFNQVRGFLIIIDKQGKLIRYNNFTLEHLGYNEPDLDQMFLQDIVSQRDVSLIHSLIGTSAEESILELSLVTARGSEIPVELSINQGMWYEQEALFIIGKDISRQIEYESEINSKTRELSEKNEQLEDINRQLEESVSHAHRMALEADSANIAKSAFLANMSHEIRTPMNAISAFTELLLNDESSEDKKEKLRMIYQSSQHLLKLLQDILDFSKIEAGKLEIEDQPFSLYELLGHLEDMFRIRAKEKDLDFQVHYEGSVPQFVSGDGQRVSQILINLLSNSFKFTREGSIKLVCRYERPWVIFSVIDSGMGIPESKIERIFQPFEQDLDRIGSKHNGTGLGLAISMQLVNLMRGDLDIASKVNRGTNITIRLPLRPVANLVQSGVSKEKIAEVPGMETGSQPVVLLVSSVPEPPESLSGQGEEQQWHLQQIMPEDRIEYYLRNSPIRLVLFDIRYLEMRHLQEMIELRLDFRFIHIPFCFFDSRTSESSGMNLRNFYWLPSDASEQDKRNLLELLCTQYCLVDQRLVCGVPGLVPDVVSSSSGIEFVPVGQYAGQSLAFILVPFSEASRQPMKEFLNNQVSSRVPIVFTGETDRSFTGILASICTDESCVGETENPVAGILKNQARLSRQLMPLHEVPENERETVFHSIARLFTGLQTSVSHYRQHAILDCARRLREFAVGKGLHRSAETAALIEIEAERNELEYDIDQIQFLYAHLRIQFVGWETKRDLITTTTSREMDDRPLKILVAEDNLINQKVLQTVLGKMGCQVKMTENGKEALDALRQDRFDLLMLDMQMPVMDGMEALKIIRSDPELRDTWIIAQTAYAMSGDERKYIEAGCDDYISKPISRKSLEDVFTHFREKSVFRTEKK